MKNNYLVSIVIAIGSISIVSSALAWPNGVSGFSGANSSGGSSCGTCHSIISTSKTDNFSLTNNIPPTGFVPNTTYDFNLTIKSKLKRIGYNIKIEDNKGIATGKIILTDTLSRIEQEELVHTYFSRFANNEGTFKFKWTAPESNDTVSLYAVVATLLKDTSVIDTLNFINYKLAPNVVSAVSDLETAQNKTTIQLNELNNIDIKHQLLNESNILFSVYTSQGLVVNSYDFGKVSSREFVKTVNISELKEGLYVLCLKSNTETIFKKIYKD